MYIYIYTLKYNIMYIVWSQDVVTEFRRVTKKKKTKCPIDD